MSSNELDLVKLQEEAVALGISFHPNTGEVKLSKLINDKKALDASKSTELTEGQKKAKMIAEMTKLVRVIVRPNDPAKRDWPGEIFTVSNAYVGTVKKHVPYNNEAGWHVPRIIIDTLKDKQVQLFRSVKSKDGYQISEAYQTKAFTIEELPPLTKQELQELAADQKSRNAIN